MAEKTISEIAKLCADCGTCQSACPVYQAELTEPNSPRGKVNLAKALADGRLAPSARNRSLLYQCLVCGGCEHACPQGVEFTRMMIEQRNRAAAGKRIPWLKKTALFFYQGFILRRVLWLPRLLARTPLKKRLSLPAFQKADLKKIVGRDRDREYDILLFPGCVFTYFYPQRTIDIKALLEKQGFSVLYPPGLQCCGFPYLSQGWGDKFAALKKKNEAVFRSIRFKRIVVPCSTGVLALRKYYDLPGIEVLRAGRLHVPPLPRRRDRPALRRPLPGTVHVSRPLPQPEIPEAAERGAPFPGAVRRALPRRRLRLVLRFRRHLQGGLPVDLEKDPG